MVSLVVPPGPVAVSVNDGTGDRGAHQVVAPDGATSSPVPSGPVIVADSASSVAQVSR